MSQNDDKRQTQERDLLTLPQIRERIDSVDMRMRDLFVERMQLSDQVAQVKARTEDQIYKPDREAQIIARQSALVDESVAMEYRAFLKRIMEVSRKYQYGRTLQLRKCFPYTFSDTVPEIGRAVMVRDELYICDFCEKDQVKTVRSYADVQVQLQAGEADTGIGIIERIGSGVSDELNSMLLRCHLYINQCRVLQMGEEKYKVVAFSKRLAVTPEHNRLKIVFITANRSGALGSILSMIADYGVNLTEIHSIPFKPGQDWNYRLFAELTLNLQDEKAQALIFQLSQETASMQLLGSYRCEGDFVS